MNLLAFSRLLFDSNITKSEVEAVAAIRTPGTVITESMVEDVESFRRKQRVILRKSHLIDLFQRGRERFGEIMPYVAASIGAIPEPERLEELLTRMNQYENWEELLDSLRPPEKTTTVTGDNS
jgi:hypothetical protein